MKVVVSMIVRDEASRYQPALARHALTWADELRVLDDGSRDDTMAQLSALGPRVRWIRNAKSRWDSDGEGAARQQLLAWTLAAGADWVVQLDADELVPKGIVLRAALPLLPEDTLVVSLRMVEVWDRNEEKSRSGPLPFFDDNETIPRPCDMPYVRREGTWWIRVDGEWAPRPSPLCWRAPSSTMRAEEAWSRGWTIPDRELACGREPEVVRLTDAVASDLDVLHLGWSDPDERQSRYDRYMRIDGGRHHDSAHLRSILRPPRLVPYPAPTDLLVKRRGT